MAKAQIGLHSQSPYSLPISVSHPLSLDLYMVQDSPSKLKIWTQQWWDVIRFRIYNFYKGFERDTLEGSHLGLCRRKKKTNHFFTLGKDEPSWIDMALFKIACVFGKFDLVAGWFSCLWFINLICFSVKYDWLCICMSKTYESHC